MHNIINVVGLDADYVSSPYNCTKLALPLLDAGIKQFSSGRPSRSSRQQRAKRAHTESNPALSCFCRPAGREDDEVYAINVTTKQLVKTFTEVDGRKLVSVKHHAFVGGLEEMGGPQDRDSASAFASESTSTVSNAFATERAGDDDILPGYDLCCPQLLRDKVVHMGNVPRSFLPGPVAFKRG